MMKWPEKHPVKHPLIAFIIAVSVLTAAGCATHPPQRAGNICEIFRERPEWYDDTAAASDRWKIPIPVMMAIIHRESGFYSDAKPPRTTCLFIFPGPRPSSAYGYPQALDATWDDYQEQTGNTFADRDDFGDAVDFVGWYCHLSHIRCGIPRDDAYRLYLAYHEGHAGYNQGTWRKKAWLRRVAQSVQRQTRGYGQQLAACESEFGKSGGCFLWPL